MFIGLRTHMKRREFLTLFGGTIIVAPLAARARTPDRALRVGMLIGYAEDDADTQARLAAFRQGLETLGWREGRNILIDYRFAPANPDQPGRSQRSWSLWDRTRSS